MKCGTACRPFNPPSGQFQSFIISSTKKHTKRSSATKRKGKVRKQKQARSPNATATVVAFEVEAEVQNNKMAETGRRFMGGQLDAPNQSDEDIRSVPQVNPNVQGEKQKLN